MASKSRILRLLALALSLWALEAQAQVLPAPAAGVAPSGVTSDKFILDSANKDACLERDATASVAATNCSAAYGTFIAQYFVTQSGYFQSPVGGYIAGLRSQSNYTITTAQTGIAVSVSASDAVAGTSVVGAAAGGAVLLTGGAAKRLTSGNANGGAITLTGGAGIGTGTTGALVATVGGVTINGNTGLTQTFAVCTGVACATTCNLVVTNGIVSGATGTCP